MSRSLVLGNGNVLLCFDNRAQLRDFYFPYVGSENHVGANLIHKVGVWVDGRISWLSDEQWNLKISLKNETMASEVVAINKEQEVELLFNDIVYNEKNIFVRKVRVKNLANRRRQLKVFFNQQFTIFGLNEGNTAYFDPDKRVIIHYRGRRIFLVGGRSNGNFFSEYSIGLFNTGGREGTWRDAEDGKLSGNAVEHGLVDSTIGFTLDLKEDEEGDIEYWIAVAKKLNEAMGLNNYLLEKSPDHLIETTQDFWHAWVNKQNFSFYGLSKEVISLFKKSLFVIRTHVDNNGAIIASGDSAMLQYGHDTYGYMWPRDGAFVALALDKAGYPDISRRFFDFCNQVISDQGYLMHKYRPDGSMGSSWHPWLQNGERRLPIQEDETAIVLYAFWEHYKISLDLEFIEKIYNSFIKNAADFIYVYRDKKTKLPLSSYDLWEEKFGTATFTASAVYGALRAAEGFAELLGKEEDHEKYKKAAVEVRASILKNLFNNKAGFFYKLIDVQSGKKVALKDDTIDISSFFGPLYFKVLKVNDPLLERAAKKVEEVLVSKVDGGIIRYENDDYQRAVAGQSNSWIITTLWYAQYFIAKAGSEKDLDKVKEILAWVVDRTRDAGILPEQVNPKTKEHLSAAPLAWSHAAFVSTVILYLEKLEELGVYKVCNPIR